MIPFTNRTFYIESYGCTYNHADAEKLADIARKQGCRQVDTAEEADVVIINTCTVIASTERAMLRRIRACAHKNLVVTGCLPVVQMDAIAAVSSPVVIPPDAITAASGRIGAVIQPGTGVLQIAKGCLGACSYCLTRFARGRLASFSERAILAEAERLIAEGACELQLTGQDVSAYGRDTGTDLPSLLGALGDLA
ncbi:MAG: 2-methylthioadenine synthetase, partial [Methanomicrobiales archaeon]|nr:2-methylthioadenine synthetase [Methanomicrobiales archaeon]